MSELKTWAQMADDDAEVIACGERWKALAATIGCALHGFNDDYSASFTTPDGNVIEIGQKFRTVLATRPAANVEAEPVAWMYERDFPDGRQTDIRVQRQYCTGFYYGWTETPLYPASALEQVRKDADARIEALEAALVTAMIPIEAILMSGTEAAFCQDVRDALHDAKNTARATLAKLQEPSHDGK